MKSWNRPDLHLTKQGPDSPAVPGNQRIEPLHWQATKRDAYNKSEQVPAAICIISASMAPRFRPLYNPVSSDSRFLDSEPGYITFSTRPWRAHTLCSDLSSPSRPRRRAKASLTTY